MLRVEIGKDFKQCQNKHLMSSITRPKFHGLLNCFRYAFRSVWRFALLTYDIHKKF